MKLPINIKLNKSYTTNTVALLFIVSAFLAIEPLKSYLLSIGMFALSGALTNTIAIYMLFEKIPFLYGSGVITLKFEAFKTSIASMIMEQFFTVEHLEKFTSLSKMDALDLEPVLEKIDLGPAYEGLVEVILSSSFGGMLGMFGGEKVLRQFQEPFEKKMRESIIEISQKESFKQMLQEHLMPKDTAHKLLEKIEVLVLGRLDELTPQSVKEMIEKIIHEHLGWLVVWGGVLGGLIGLISALIFS